MLKTDLFFKTESLRIDLFFKSESKIFIRNIDKDINRFLFICVKSC